MNKILKGGKLVLLTVIVLLVNQELIAGGGPANFNLVGETLTLAANDGCEKTTYTFSQTNANDKDAKADPGETITITFPAGTDASTATVTGSSCAGTAINGFTVQTATTLAFLVPAKIDKDVAFNIVIANVTNGASLTSSCSINMENKTGGSNTGVGYNFTTTACVPMSYVSNTCNRTDTTSVDTTDISKQIIGIEVVMTGTLTPFDLTQIIFNMASTTSIADVSNINIYYTGTDASYSASNLFGTAAPAGGNITVNGTQTLSKGTNYFWIAYDITSGAASVGNIVDAAYTQITVDGVNQAGTGSCTGGREIEALPPGGWDSPNPPSDFQTIPAGSLVIPMGNATQNEGARAPLFNMKAYGLIHALLQEDIPVKWIITSGKMKDGIDMTANVTKVYPNAAASASVDFVAGAFVIDPAYINTPKKVWTETATQVINAYGNDVVIYTLDADKDMDVRYELDFRPKIAVFSNGGNQQIHMDLLEEAGLSSDLNFYVIDAGVFTGIIQCYTFCSEPHWAGSGDFAADKAVTDNIYDYVQDGGNFLAQCRGIETYENHSTFKTTDGIDIINNNLDYHIESNGDLAFMQYEGEITLNEGGSEKNWWMNAASDANGWNDGYYDCIEGVSGTDTTVVSTGAHLISDQLPGGNVWYLGGHDYGDYDNLTAINAGRMYMNATLVPSGRPVPFEVDVVGDTTICNGECINIGGTAKTNTTYIWTPAADVNNASSANPTACPSDTTIYTVFADNGGCESEGGMQINVAPAPTVDAGFDTTICGGTPTIDLIGAVTNATGGSWRSIPGGGTFFPDSTSLLGSTYTPSAAEIAAGSIMIELTATGACFGKTDTFNVTIIPILTAVAGPDDTVCVNSPAVALTGIVTGAPGIWSSATGTGFTPTVNSMLATYTLDASELLLPSVELILTTDTTGISQCAAGIDTLEIFVVASPIISAGPDDTVCDNSLPVVLQASSSTGAGIWTNISGDVTGFVNVNDSITTYTATAAEILAGFAELIWTSQNNGLYCIAETDTMRIIINKAAVPTAPDDFNVCFNNADFSITGTTIPVAQSVIWSTTMPGSWSSNDSTSYTVTYNPSSVTENTTYDVVFCIANPAVACLQECDTTEVTVTPAPQVNACDGCGPLDYELLCAGNCLANLKGAFTNQVNFPGSGVVWDVQIGGTSVTDINAVVDNVNDLASQYCPGVDETPVLPVQLQQVSLILTPTSVGNCLVVPDTANLTIVSLPAIEAGPNQQVCENNLTTLTMNSTATYGITSQAAAPTWTSNPVSGTFSADIEDPDFTFTTSPTAGDVINMKICISRLALFDICPLVCDSMDVTIMSIPTAHAGVDQVVCGNNPDVTFTGDTTSGNAGGGLSLQWTNIFGTDGTFGSATDLSTTYSPDASQIATAASQTPAPPADSTWCAEFRVSDVSGLCSSVADTVCVSATPSPLVEAGPSDTVCDNNRSVVIGGTVGQGATQGIWSGGTNIFLPNPTTLINVGYSPVTADSVTLMLCSTNGATLNNCLEVCDSMKIYVTSAPMISAGPDDTSCVNNPNVTLAGTFDAVVSNGIVWRSFAGTFNPAIDSTNPTGLYQPDASEIGAGNTSTDLIISTTGSGRCVEITDTMTIFFEPTPVVDAGNDVFSCANNPVATVTGTVSNANGIIWSTNRPTDVTIVQPDSLTTDVNWTSGQPTEGDSVRMYLTSVGNGTCNPVLDSMTIYYTPSPIVDAGLPDTSCANNEGLSLNASLSGSISTSGIWSGFDPLGSFIGGDETDTVVTYIPTATEITAGSIMLYYTTTDNGNCTSVTDSVLMEILVAPIIEAGAADTVCADNLPLALAGNVTSDGSEGGVGISWIGPAGSSIVTSTNPNGNYTPASGDIPGAGTTTPVTSTIFIVSTGSVRCIEVTDSVNITIMPSPTVEAGADIIACGNAATITLSPTSINVTSGSWTGGNGSFAGNVYTVNAQDITDSIITLYYCSNILDYAGCSNVCDSLQISFADAPIASAGVPQTICSTDFPVQLDASGSSPGAWVASEAGTFLPNTAALNATWTPTNSVLADRTVTFTWNTTAFGPCATISDNVDILLKPGPIVDAGDDDTLCSDIACVTLAGSITNAGGTGFWNVAAGEDLGIFGNGFGTVTPNSYCFDAGNYSNGYVNLVLCNSDLSNCSQVCDTVKYTLTDLVVIDAGIDRTICGDQDTLQLFGTVQTATGGTWTTTGSTANGPFDNASSLTPVYTWDPSTLAPGDTVGTADSIKLYITSTGNGLCQPQTDSMVIHITPAPTVEAGPNDTICYDETFYTLNGIISVSSQGVWSNNTLGVNVYDNGGIFNSSTAPINYYRTVEDSNATWQFNLTTQGSGQCQDVSDSMLLTVLPAPAVFVGNDTSTCSEAGSFTLNGSMLNSSTGTWSSSSSSGSFNGTETNLIGAVYTFGPADTNGVIFFKLVSTDNGNCFADSATMQLTLTPEIIVEAGPNQTFCATTDTVQLNGSVQNAGGGTWSTLTGGMFVNTLDLGTKYARSPADSAAGCINLYLDSRLEGLCSAQRDSMTICFTPVPIIDAGPNDTVCADTAGILVMGSVLNATGVHWSSSSDSGFFVNQDTVNATLVLSDNDTVQGIQPLQLCLTSTGNGLCAAVTDCMDLLVTPIPTIATAGFDTICADVDSVQITSAITVASGVRWTTTGNGRFADSLQLTTMYDVTVLDTSVHDIRFFAVTTGNGLCKEYTDILDLHIIEAPSMEAGPNQTICRDVSIVSLNGSVAYGDAVWTSADPLGTFADSSDVGTDYIHNTTNPTIPDTVMLTLTNFNVGGCSPISDSIRLIITPIPIMDAGDVDTICADSAALQLSGTFANTGGGVWSSPTSTAFSTSPNETNATYTFDSLDYVNGGVVLDWTSTSPGTCNPVTDQLAITITPAPTVNANIDQLICESSGGTIINGSITVASGSVWSTSGGGSFVDSSLLFTTYVHDTTDINNGIVILTLTTTGNGLCNAVSANMQLSIDQIPSLNAGFSQTVCANSDTILMNGTFGGADYVLWSTNGFGTFSDSSATPEYYVDPSDSSAGAIKIFAETVDTNGVCGAAFDTIDIVFTPVPTVTINSVAVCSNDGGLFLYATRTNANGVTWTTNGTGGGSEFSSIAADTTFYTPHPTDVPGSVLISVKTNGSGGCSAGEDAKDIAMDLRADPIVEAGPDQLVCEDEDSVSVGTGASITNPTGALSWSSNSNGIFDDNSVINSMYAMNGTDLALNSTTLYLCTENNGICPQICDSIVVTIVNTPTVLKANDLTRCADEDSICLDGATAGQLYGGEVSWTSLGTGTFNDSTSLNPCYLPSLKDDTTAIIQLSICATGHSTCQTYCDTSILTLTPIPTVQVRNFDTICADYILDGDPFDVFATTVTEGTWTYSGTPDSLGLDSLTGFILEYYISLADTANGPLKFEFCADDGNGRCQVYCDSMQLTINPAPIIDVGDSALCSSEDSVLVTASMVVAGEVAWTSDGDGTFADTSANPTYYRFGTQDKATTKRVVITGTTAGNGFCNAVLDSVVVNYTDPYFVYAGPDQSVCADTAIIQLDGGYNSPTVDSVVWTSLGNGLADFSDINDTNGTYKINQDNIDSNIVQLVLTTAVGALCPEISDTMNIVIYDLPIVTASALNACAETDTIAVIGTVIDTAGMVGTGYWLSSGDGSWDPDSLTLSTNYIRGSGDSTLGNFLLTLTADPYGLCNTVFDTIRINLIPVPQVITVDTVICKDADSIQLRADFFADTNALVTWSGGNGTFSMGDFANGVDSIFKTDSSFMTYYFDALDTVGVDSLTIYITNDGGSCSAVTDSIIIRFNPVPVVIAASDAACSVFDTVNLIGTVFNADSGRWSHLGAAIGFLFHPDSLLNEYEPVTADTAAPATKCVDFILTSRANRGCKAYSDTTNICFTTPPDISAGVNDTVCADVPFFTLTGTIDLTASTGGVWTPSVTGGSFAIDSTDLNATYTYPTSIISQTSDTTISVILTSTGNGLCPAVMDTVLLTVTHPLITSSVDTITVCGDTSSVPVQVTINDVVDSLVWRTVNGSGTFADSTANNTTYDFSSADSTNGFATVSYTAYDSANCKPISDTILILITPVPTVDAGTGEVCADNAIINLNGTITLGDTISNDNGEWMTSTNGTFSAFPTVAEGQYLLGSEDTLGATVILKLTIKNQGLCKSYSDSLILNVIPTPSADAGLNQIVCAGNDSVTILGLVSTDSSAWISRGTGTFVDSLSDTTVYVYSQGDSLAGSVVLVLETTFDNRGCTPGLDSMLITIADAPILDAGPADTACYESTPGVIGEVQLSASYQFAGGIEWTAENGVNTPNPNFSPSNSDTLARYQFIPADSCGPIMLYAITTGTGSCNPVMDSVEIFVRCVPSITQNADTTVCSDIDSVQICVVVDNATGVAWTTSGDGSFNDTSLFCSHYIPGVQDLADSLVVLTPSTTGNEECQIYSESFTMNFTESPTIEAGLPQSICSQSGDSIFLTPTVTIANAYAWTTVNGSGTFVDSSLLDAVYVPGATDSALTVQLVLIVSDTVTGCKSYTDTVDVVFEPAVLVSAGGPLDTICADIGTINLDGSVLVASGGLWSTIDGDPTMFNPLPPAQDSVLYTLTAADTVRGTVSFILQSTGGGNCLTVFDTVRYVINPAPEVFAGMNDTICADAVVYGLNGSIDVTGQGVWTSTGDGMFADSSQLSTIYTLGVTDATSTPNLLNFTLTSTNNGLCNPKQDIVQLAITEVPIVTAGFNKFVCQDKGTIDFSGQNASISGISSEGVWSTCNGTGTFNDSIFGLMHTYTMTQADQDLGNTSDSLCFVLRSTDNGTCNPVSDTMYVLVRPQPTVTVDNTPNLLNDTLSICADRDTITFVGVVTNTPSQVWSSTHGSISQFDDPNGLAPVFSPADSLKPTPGSLVSNFVGITLTTVGNVNGCEEVDDAFILEITPEPIINIVEPDSVCADVDSVEFTATFATATGILWSSSDLSSSFNTTTSLPTWYVPGDTDRAFGLANITINTTGNGLCSSVTDQLSMVITPRPEIDAGPDLEVCADFDTLHIQGASTNTVVKAVRWTTLEGNNANFTDRFSLSTGYLFESADIPPVGDTVSKFMTFILETTDVGDCKNIYDTVMVEIKPRPFVTVTTGDICADLNGLEVNGTFNNTNGLLWSSAHGIFGDYVAVSTQFTPDASVKPGVAVVKVCSDGSGTCQEVCDSLDVIIDDLPEPDAGLNQLICRGDSAQLLGTDLLGTGVTFTWYDSTGMAPILASSVLANVVVTNENSKYIFEIFDANGCSRRDTMEVDVVDPPRFNLLPHYCYNDTLELNSAVSGIPPIPLTGQFQWFNDGAVLTGNGATDSIYRAPVLNEYTITWTQGSCVVKDTTRVTPLPELTSEDPTICNFGSVDLLTSTGLSNYSWSEVGGLGQTGAGNPFNATGIGSDSVDQIFLVSADDSLGCRGTDSVYLSEITGPDLAIDPGNTCEGIEATLVGYPLNDTIYDLFVSDPAYTWYFEGDSVGNDTTYTTLIRGEYVLKYQLEECISYDTTNLAFHVNPIANPQDSGEFCVESDVFLDIDGGTIATSSLTYLWDENAENQTTQIARIYTEGIYEVEVTDTNGCKDTADVFVNELCPPVCHLPDAFSPDGSPCDPTCTQDDNITCEDNCFYVFCKNHKDYKLTVFNRWGEIIFYSERSDYVWDGTYLGEDMPSGLYPWTMEYNADDVEFERPKYVSGKILIIR